ncbi:hypothetical protein J2Z47_003937 [Cohnella thailandensis]|nr:hypothetical protein [Cohnella thailandensis]
MNACIDVRRAILYVGTALALYAVLTLGFGH